MTFVLVGGRVSLDFLATRTERRHAPVEQLGSPNDLAQWAREACLVDDGFEISAAQFTEAIEVREALYRTVSSAVDGDRFRAADVAVLNRVARAAPITVALTWAGTLRRRGDVDQLMATVVRDGLELLGSEQFDRVRECDRLECTRLYVDSSRTGNRRWCDMAECGNRAKVAAFRRRQHGWSERSDDAWSGGNLSHLPVGD